MYSDDAIYEQRAMQPKQCKGGRAKLSLFFDGKKENVFLLIKVQGVISVT